MNPSSFTSSFRSAAQTALAFLAFAVCIELVIGTLLHPADIADVRQGQARHRFEQRCLVLGDSVANQLAPPIEGSPLRRMVVGGRAAAQDPRGPRAKELDQDCVFLTTTAGATRVGDLFLLEQALAAGSHPKEIHLILSPGGWSAGREGNWNFEEGFTARFSSPDQIVETYHLEHDAALAGRQIGLGWLPSVRARGPYGQRVLGMLVPHKSSTPLGLETPKWSVSRWNRLALPRIAQLAKDSGATLAVHMAPHPAASLAPDDAAAWQRRMSDLKLVAGPTPPTWNADWYRDGVHLKHEYVPRLVEWFFNETGPAPEPK